MSHSLSIPTYWLAALLVLASPLPSMAAEAGEDAPSPPATGAGNYLIPVPPDLPQRLTEAQKREDTARAAEAKAKSDAARARAAADQSTPPKQPSETTPGLMIFH